MELIRLMLLVIGVVVLSCRSQCADNGAISSHRHLEKTVERLEKIISELDQKVTQQQQTMYEMKNTMNEHLQTNKGSAGVVAFNVRRGAPYGPVGVNTQIPYPIINLNIGSAYDAASSDFIAPMKGIYFFYYVNEHAEAGTWTLLVVNGAVHQQVASSAGADSGTGCTTIQLEIGDIVNIFLYGNDVGLIDCNASGIDCQFGGFLLYQIL